ncbi:MAG: FGGY family carbohydrate kinase, partial [Tropicimonas sp.]|uniref:FGGY family carbohydrate kinase n=1 Tax=Tropicimonas sp. TaxID=2067044 RepID=UPI003A866110
GSLKAGVVDARLSVHALASAPVPTARPRPGIAEQSADHWFTALALAGRAAVEQAGGGIDAIAFTGHMSAPCLVNAGGRPFGPVRTLADTQCAHFLSQDAGIGALSGNEDGTHFGRAKILHGLSEVPARKIAGVLAPKDVLRMALGGSLASDPSDLANFLLLEVATGRYHADLCCSIGLAEGQLPALKAADSVDGALNADWAGRLGLRAGIPLVTGAGDMGSAALGVGLSRGCDAAITIGTAATILAAVPEVSAQLRGKLTFHLDGVGGRFALASHFNGGAVLDWLHRLSGTNEARNAWLLRLATQAAARAPTARPLVLPYLLGSGSPRFDRAETARIAGLSADHDMADLIAAFQEGVAFDLADSIDALAGSGIRTGRICLGGGGTKLPGWAGMVCNVLGRALMRPADEDLSLIGAACLGFRGLGAEVAPPGPVAGWAPDPAQVRLLRERRARAVAMRDAGYSVSPSS